MAAPIDLHVSVTEIFGPAGDREGLRVSVTVAADLFDPAAATMFAERFARVLDGVTADPQVRLRQVDVLGEEERLRILSGWNHSAQEDTQ
jgi:non-ribosomal peptide synthetase component F